MARIIAAFLIFSIASEMLLATDDSTVTDAACQPLEHSDGSTKDICDKSDKTYLLLEFFSARCGFCRRNVPWFKRLEEATADTAHSRLISLNTVDEARQFAEEFSIITDIAIDISRTAQLAFKVTHVPTLFVIDANNKIIFSHVGLLDDALINRIVGLMESPREQIDE